MSSVLQSKITILNLRTHTCAPKFTHVSAHALPWNPNGIFKANGATADKNNLEQFLLALQN